MRKLLVFGNGLGRAIDNAFYDITRALNASWDDAAVLSEQQKKLILQCLPQDVIEGNGAPSGENDLDLLQRILAACDLINEVERNTIEKGWLRKAGKAFPAAIRRYLHRAACEFHTNEHKIPEDFAKPLRDYIASTKSHVATLNYDNLLYGNFIGTAVFKSDTCLIDGFIYSRFKPEVLARKDNNKTSYYLHLHGSPLFHDDETGAPCKMKATELDKIAGTNSAHIVLTKVEHKESVIAASPILSAYWSHLDIALREVEGIILFGYSGLDTHLNRRIHDATHRKKIPIQIVEYKGAGQKADRQRYWDDIFGQVRLHRPKNLLDFRDWSTP